LTDWAVPKQFNFTRDVVEPRTGRAITFVADGGAIRVGDAQDAERQPECRSCRDRRGKRGLGQAVTQH
jgi:hypothetical protein